MDYSSHLTNFSHLFSNKQKPIIGMVHLKALPGSPSNSLSLEEIIEFGKNDLTILEEGGIDGVIIENYNDYPFFPNKVEPITITSMTLVVNDLIKSTKLPVGVNILRNACSEALTIASLLKAHFIRSNIWTGAYITDQGIIEGCSHLVKRLQKTISSTTKNCSTPLIFADVHCKHSSPLSARSIASEVQDTFERGLADAVIITGERTGLPAKLEILKSLKVKGFAPIIVGSGVTSDNVSEFLPYCDGLIVGTSLKKNGLIDNPVDLIRVKKIVNEVNNVRTK